MYHLEIGKDEILPDEPNKKLQSVEGKLGNAEKEQQKDNFQRRRNAHQNRNETKLARNQRRWFVLITCMGDKTDFEYKSEQLQ